MQSFIMMGFKAFKQFEGYYLNNLTGCSVSGSVVFQMGRTAVVATGSYTSYPTSFLAAIDWTSKQQCYFTVSMCFG
jgi:hypothetical protein